MFKKDTYFVVYDKESDDILAVFESYYNANEFASLYGEKDCIIELTKMRKISYLWLKFILWFL